MQEMYSSRRLLLEGAGFSLLGQELWTCEYSAVCCAVSGFDADGCSNGMISGAEHPLQRKQTWF